MLPFVRQFHSKNKRSFLFHRSRGKTVNKLIKIIKITPTDVIIRTMKFENILK